MQIDIATIRVAAKKDLGKDAPQIYRLAVQSIVLIWDEAGSTWCKDVLGNEWFVLSIQH